VQVEILFAAEQAPDFRAISAAIAFAAVSVPLQQIGIDLNINTCLNIHRQE
jgi:hypothetical protein